MVSYLFLFFEHLVKDGQYPVFEFDVVVVGHQKVPYPVDALLPEVAALQGEVAHVGRGKALDKVLLYTAGCGHYAVYLEKSEWGHDRRAALESRHFFLNKHQGFLFPNIKNHVIMIKRH